MTVYIPDGSFFEELSSCLSNLSRESALDRLSMKGTCGLEEIVPLLKTKTEDPTRVVINSSTDDDWRFSLIVNSRRTFFWDDGGSLAVAFDSELIDQIGSASANVNLDQLLDSLATLLGNAILNVEAAWSTPFDTLGAHYIETVELFVEKALGDDWHVFARQLADKSSVLIIGDLVGQVACHSYEILGHGMSVSSSTPVDRVGALLPTDGRPRLPSPTYFAPIAHVAGIPSRDRLLEVLNGMTRALTWYWMANAVTSDSRVLTLHFSGSRVIEISRHCPRIVESAKDEIRLAEWTFASDDPARLEAVRKAASLALVDNNIFDGAAAAVLRTAESLFEIARRDVIAEALATRRTARQAAISAANDAAKSAREASAKSVERSAVQVAAALAIVVANVKEFVNLLVAVIILSTIAVVAVVSWLVSKNVEIEAAGSSLDNFVEDLDEYRDTLSASDIQHLQELRSIVSARKHLMLAKKVSKWLVIGVEAALIATILVLSVLFLIRPGREGSQPTRSIVEMPSTTTTSTSSIPIVTTTQKPVR